MSLGGLRLSTKLRELRRLLQAPISPHISPASPLHLNYISRLLQATPAGDKTLARTLIIILALSC